MIAKAVDSLIGVSLSLNTQHYPPYTKTTPAPLDCVISKEYAIGKDDIMSKENEQ